MKDRACFILLILAISCLSVHGAEYYFSSSSGDDAATCNSTDPCQTLTKLNDIVSSKGLSAGDSILFKSGDTFHGQVANWNWKSGSASAPILFSSYGNGTQPVISGTTVVSGWSQTSNGMYQAQVNSTFTDVENVFIDGQKMTWARTPNLNQPPATRYLNITASTGNSLSTDQVTDPSGTWDGAIIRVRIYLWSVGTFTVQSHTYDGSVATFTLTQSFVNGYQPGVGWKFFLENKVQAIDQPGEWAFDASSGTLTIMPPLSDWSPSSSVVEASVFQAAFMLVISSYMTFNDLHFHGQTQAAIQWSGSGASSSNIQITGCTFTDQEQTAIVLNAVSNVVVSNCSFTGQQNTAISAGIDGLTIEYSTFTNIGMVQGHQNPGGGTAIGIISGSGLIVQYNVIQNISYNGIVFTNAQNSLIQNNLVAGCTLTMSDGGGIYTYGQGSQNGQLLQNFVINITSLPWDGFTDGSAPLSNGIYLDNYCSGHTVAENTVVNIGTAPFFANSGNHKWTGNTIVGGGAEGMIGIEEMSGNTVVGSVYSDNIVYIRQPGDVGAIKETSNVHQNTTQMASFANNVYCNPYGPLFFVWNNVGFEGGRGWETWLASGSDSGSTLCKVMQDRPTFQPAGNVTKVMAVLNQNPDFAQNVNGWNVAGSNAEASWVETSPVSSNGSLAVTINSTSASPVGIQIQQVGLSITEGVYYRLRLDAATKNGELSLWMGIMLDGPPWSNPSGNNLAFIINSQPQHFEYVFSSVLTGSVLLELGGSLAAGDAIYIANFYLEEVDVQPNEVVLDFVALNPSGDTAQVPIPANTTFTDINGENPVSCSVTLGPWQSIVLVYAGAHDGECSSPTAAGASKGTSVVQSPHRAISII